MSMNYDDDDYVAESAVETDWLDDDGFSLDEYEAKTGFIRLGPGSYPVEVISVEGKKSKKGVPNIVFTYKVTDGEFKGAQHTEWIQFTEKGKPYIKGRYVSLGCSDEPGTVYRKEDVIGVEAVMVLYATPNPENKDRPFINVDSVKIAAPARTASPTTTKSTKRSGGDLLG